MAIRIADAGEERLPDLGLVKFYDPETGETTWLDTADSQVRSDFASRYRGHLEATMATLKRYGIDQTTLYTGQDYVKEMKKLFEVRSKGQ